MDEAEVFPRMGQVLPALHIPSGWSGRERVRKRERERDRERARELEIGQRCVGAVRCPLTVCKQESDRQRVRVSEREQGELPPAS